REIEFSNAEIMDLIKNGEHTDASQFMLVDFYFFKNSHSTSKNSNSEMKALLKEKNISKEIKVKILSDATIDSSDESLLLDFINNDSNQLSFVSMKKLSQINSKKAFEIAQDILKNTDIESNMRISAALKAVSNFLTTNESASNYKEIEADFINQANEIM